MTDIVIDTREKYAEYFSEQLPKRDVVIQKLEVGDFLIPGQTEEDAILIERKDDSDFLGSLAGTKDIQSGLWTQGRLWNQLERMTLSGCGKLRLLIEGNPYRKGGTAYKKMGFTKMRIMGAFEGVFDWGIPIKQTKNRADTAEWLEYLINRQNRPKKLYPLRASAKKEMSLRDKKLYLLQGFPKIGPKTSNAILDEYPTLIDALFNVSKWNQIKRIGTLTSNEIHKILVSNNE